MNTKKVKANFGLYCEKGEINAITKEVFCNLYNEFCKFTTECKYKTNKN